MAEKDNNWVININSFGGFSPAWFENSYSMYGNKNHANDMNNVDILDPNVLTQGPGAVDLTNGDENGAVTTLISSMLRGVVSSNVSYAIGGAKMYQLSATTVTNAGVWPHTITGSGTITGCDLVHYKGYVLYSYNDADLGGAGVQKGNIGAYNVDTPGFDDTYWTGTLSGTALEDAPHYMIVGGDDVCYITNGQYIATLDDTTDNAQGLDFWQNSVVVSLTWNQNRIWAAVNRPNVSGSNFNQSGIYRWNGVSSFWEGDPIEVSGRIGALYTKNGVTYVWWQEGISDGGYSLGYIDGTVLKILRRYKGSLPNHSQVGEYDGLLGWISDNQLYLWGSKDADIPVKLFQYASPKQATAGAWAVPFGTPLLASYSGSNYSLAKLSGYTVSADHTSMVFKVSGAGFKSQIDLIQVDFEPLATGAKVDTTLYYNKKALNNNKLEKISARPEAAEPSPRSTEGHDSSTGATDQERVIRGSFLQPRSNTRFNAASISVMRWAGRRPAGTSLPL